MDSSKVKRARLAVQKCAAGSAMRPSMEMIKAEWAKQQGLTYKDGQFFDKSGNTVNAAPTPGQLEAVGDGLEAKAQKAATVYQGINTAIDMGSSMLQATPNVQNQSAETLFANGMYDQTTNIVSQIDPKIGTIMKMGGFASDAMTAAGIGTDQKTGMDKAMDSKFLKPIVGWVNAVGASKLDDFSMDKETLEVVGGDYTGSMAEGREAEDLAGSKVGLFNNHGKLNDKIARAKKKFRDMSVIAQNRKDQAEMVSQMGDLMADQYHFQTEGGFNAKYAKAQQGGQLKPKFEPELIDYYEVSVEKIVPMASDGGSLFGEKINPTSGQIEAWTPELVDIDSFKPGGKIEKQLDAPEIEESSQKNLIPEGALHKNRHHMENAEDLTKKGIPVTDLENKQQAEIECNEIIFNKEVTAKLEELYKKFYDEDTKQAEKDELAIEAGKLLTREIMLNTDDRTGLIDTLKNGGTLETEKLPE